VIDGTLWLTSSRAKGIHVLRRLRPTSLPTSLSTTGEPIMGTRVSRAVSLKRCHCAADQIADDRTRRGFLRRILRLGASDDCLVVDDSKKERVLGAQNRVVPRSQAFLDVPGVEPTNDASELGLRHAVIGRKLSFDNQSTGGSQFVDTILTVVENPLLHFSAGCDRLRNRGAA
jgi:hypothetical protein